MSVLTVIVPVLNEAPNMERLMGAFQEIAVQFAHHQPCFILVDDGSSDGTAEKASSLAGNLNFKVLRHEVNRGPGMAFSTAFEHLAPTLQADDWVVTLEGDNTSRHEMLRQMFTRMEEGFDVVFASPYLYGGGITNTDGIRVFLSEMANVFVKEILGLGGLVTVSSFYRLYRGSAIQRLQAVYGVRILERSGFECMVEMCLKMIYLGFTISEIAMVLDTSRRIGRSKMKIGRTIRGYIALQGLRGGWQTAAKRTHNGLHSS